MRVIGKRRDLSHLEPFRGQKHSDETKKLISEKAKGRTWAHDEDRVRKHVEARRGKKLSPEQVEKVRQSHIGKKRSEEACEAMSAWQQRFYRAISPDGFVFELTSRELTDWLPKHGLNRTNFCKAVKTCKPYKGWVIVTI